MLIPVIYSNGRYDMVKDFMLTRMIEQQEIVQFKRKEGWIAIQFDQIRGQGYAAYAGPERRQFESAEVF